MSAADFVADDEQIYRRVPIRFVQVLPDGMLRATSQAFADRAFEISVDRARLCSNGPRDTQRDPSDGVLGLVVGVVRAPLEQRDAKGGVVATCNIDVLPAPLLENAAHALIVIMPPCPPDRLFRKLCARLALLAEQHPWEIAPRVIV
jgi:hypothetical protein